VWSEKEVPYTNARPGDIAQFVSWNEKVTFPNGAWSTYSTGPRHTAVVTRAFKQEGCELEMYDQNPSPVKKTVYHPCPGKKMGGSLIIFRLTTTSRLEEMMGDDPVPEEFKQNAPLLPMVLPACGAALLVMASIGLMVWRLKSRRSGFSDVQLLSTEDEVSKDEESPTPEE
jgi:hypothetical protein